MNIPGPMDEHTQAHRARWMWRWHKQGGSSFWKARDLQDYRNAEDLRRWRALETKLRAAKRAMGRGGKVVNVTAWKFARARRQRA